MLRQSAALYQSVPLGFDGAPHPPAFGRCGPLLCSALLLAAVLALTSPASAQNADTRDIDAYLHAIEQPAGSLRAAALERFAADAHAGNLRLDALQWIVWEERRAHNDAAAVTWSHRLLAVDPDNALALAITNSAAPRGSPPRVDVDDQERDSAMRGFASLPRLRRPEGMSHDDFIELQRLVEGRLNAVLGYAQLERHYYPEARNFLATAVAVSPEDPQLVYSLALADLEGEKPNRPQGYWMLARAINLFGGPSAVPQVEQFGRKRYKQDGGTDRDWDRYLSSTAGPGANAAMVVSTAGEPPPSGARKPPSKGHVTPPPATTAASSPATSRGQQVAAAKQPARNSKGGWKGEAEPPPESSAAANVLPPLSDENRAAPARRTGPPVSLGILIETSLARKSTREAVVNSLGDLVRHLGLDDEAFILSFSHDLVFEEDLTGDASRLQHAMDAIKPHPGTALLDAVGFAAGHLRRISKNDSRVLLVISDGRNANSRIPAPAASSEIRASGVKIYCIGVDVGGNDGIYRLQALASGTGGTASFVTAPDQFRAAAQRVAGSIGIPFEF